MIKTIFFDFGGVLIKNPKRNKVLRWKKLLGLQENSELLTILQSPNESKLIQDMCLGVLPEEKIWDLMADSWHLKPAMIQKIHRMVNSKRHLNKAMLRFLEECKNNYQTAILSNAGDQTRKLMEDNYHLDRFVDEIIISAEEGVIKPDPEIFRIALRRLSANAETSLLIDDTMVNVDAARAFGMKAVHYQNHRLAIEEIRQLLIKER
jgi:putative hydrolase of the HAD superfamily